MAQVNEERIRLWTEALRSGRYGQAFGRLHRIQTDCQDDGEEGWCCLGVACDVADRNGLWVSRCVEESPCGCLSEGFDNECFNMPDRVVGWYRLPSPFIVLKAADGTQTTAEQWNDDRRATFPEIADAIERTYLS